jgi:hypothetical protein
MRRDARTLEPRPALELEDPEEELVMFLERDQLVGDKRSPVPRAELGPRAARALWALRIFGLVVAAMVIYTFFAQLH